MADERQMIRWVEACLRLNMRADVVGISDTPDERSIRITLRNLRTQDESGQEFLVSVDLVPF